MSIYKTKKADLKGKYKFYLEISFIITLILLIAAFKYVPNAKTTVKILDATPEIPTIFDAIDRTEQNTKPPDLPKPLEPVISYADEIDDINFASTEINYDDIISLPPPLKEQKIIEEEENIFVAVEEMPEIIGGLAAIQSKISYTELARKAGIEGKIIVTAIINEEGKVIHAEVVKGLIPQLDELALNAVKSTLFKPGRQRGKPVKVQMSIPISFKLR